jgi:WD40 repeat protein
MLNRDIHLGSERDDLQVTGRNQALKLNNPFPGLRSFTLDECHLFFGREGQVDEVLVKLMDNRFVTVMGASGTGKSSLIHCGLKPTLYGGFMTEMGPDWTVVASRPGNSPIDNLADQFLEKNPSYENYTEEENLVNKTIITSILRSGPDGLIELSKQYIRDTGSNLLIYIDQFEELFRVNADDADESIDNEAAQYVNLLLEAVRQKRVPIYVALSMRSDYLGECAQYTGLTQMVNASNYLVPQMTRDQLRMAVVGPIAVGGGEVSDRLLKRLLSDIGDNQDQLPILQHALMRTWDYWADNRDDDEVLDIRHYNAIGQLSHALSQHADEAYEELSLKEKSISAILFKSITEKGNDNLGVRRPMPLSNIAEIASVSEEELIEVVEKFRAPGRSILLPNSTIPLNGDSIIEVSHESLMRIWARLKNWVEEEYESAQMYKRLSEAAAMYQVGKTGLWRPPDLQLALNWQKKQQPTRFWGQRYNEAFERSIVFLDTSRITFEAEQKNQEMLQQRLLKRAKVVAIILGIAAVISILFLVFAFIQKQAADEQKLIAVQQKDLAVANEQIAVEQTAEAVRQKSIADDRYIEIEKQKIVLEKALQDAEIARNEAVISERVAKQQTQIATDQKEVAESEKVRANENYEVAVENKALADNLYMQQLAQSVAVKSLQVEDDNLKGLLAQQAFMFNQESGGRPFDPYIYDGLYFSMAQLDGKAFNTVKAHRNAVRSVAIDQTGTHFYSTGSDGNILRSSIEALESIESIGNNQHANKALAISNDNKWLAIGTDSTAVQLYHMINGSKASDLVEIEGHTSFVYDVKFSPDDKGLYSLSNDRTLRLYDFESSKLVRSFNTIYKTFDISSDGKWMVLGSVDGRVSLLDLVNDTEEQILSLDNTPIHDVVFSHSGQFIAIGDENGNLKLWNTQSKTIVEDLKGHKARVNSIAFTKDDKLVASASYDGTIQLWVMDKLGQLPIVLKDNGSYIWDIAFTGQGHYLIAGGNNGETRVWPTDASDMASDLCSKLERNMTPEEWERYIGTSVEFRNTCKSLLLEKR